MENKIEIPKGKKVFFASDNHLGAPNTYESKIRELHFLNWLNYVDKEVGALFLLGDLFDFWYEYKTVVPKGFVRVLGKIAEISDRGIPVYFFVGNHDQWMINYFEVELGIKVYYQTKEFQIEGKTFFIGHGDGLGPNDIGYKIMKKIFRNSIFQTMFRWIHPDIGMKLGHYFSVKNKIISGKRNEKLQKEENNWLIDYAKVKNKEKKRNFFLFGHQHYPCDIKIDKDSRYINLGDWIDHYSFAEFDGTELKLKYWNI